MMQLRLFEPSLVALLVASAPSACVPGLAAREVQNEERALDRDGFFSLENVNGRVTVSTWEVPKVRIEAEKAAFSPARLSEIRVEIQGQGRDVSVKTRLPRSWFFGGQGEVDYRITVPAGARVRVTNVNGSVDIRDVAGELRASTVNGSVEIADVSGGVEATTVNGRIRARYRAAGAGRNRFSTTNGSIAVTVPEGVGGNLEARTVNGSVHCDVPLETTRRSTRHHLEGRLGKGTGSFELSTVNGSIRLERS